MSYHGRGRGGGYRGRGRGHYGGPQDSHSNNQEDDCQSRSSGGDDAYSSSPMAHSSAAAQPDGALESFFRSVDGGNYGQLRQLTGQTYTLKSGPTGISTITFTRIQPDPFAPGSQVCVRVPLSCDVRGVLHLSGPLEGVSDDEDAKEQGVARRRVAAEDLLLRYFIAGMEKSGFARGAVQVTPISQHILPRSAAFLEVCNDSSGGGATLSLFFRVKLPGHGRRIDGRGACMIFFDSILPAVEQHVMRCATDALRRHVVCAEDQEWLRGQLRRLGLVAFVVDGAVLPRASGDSDGPLTGPHVVPFAAPPSLQKEIRLPYSGRVLTGMALPRGLTLIAGGGFHGKSTLMRALELGVYNHVSDDGRTFVVVDPTAVKIRAEDRRAVGGVDISPFITNLPFQTNTTAFSTTDASGSTSQAANIMEALELGCGTLLLDEDTSATNFMFRDALMEKLVPPTQEPITSFVHRISDLIQLHDVSVVLVMGSTGQYFPMADTVLVMKAYHVSDATSAAKSIAAEAASAASMMVFPDTARPSQSAFSFPASRTLDYSSTFQRWSGASQGRDGGAPRGLKMSGSGLNQVRAGNEDIDVGLVEQLVEEGQLNAIAQCLAMIYDGGHAAAMAAQQTDATSEPARSTLSGIPSLVSPAFYRGLLGGAGGRRESPPAVLSPYGRLVWTCEARLRAARMEVRTPSSYLPRGFTTLPRVFEIGAALNRLRSLAAGVRK